MRQNFASVSRVEMSEKENMLPRNVGIQLSGHATSYFRRKETSAKLLQSFKEYTYWDIECSIQNYIYIAVPPM